jgi:hypothetical protein
MSKILEKYNLPKTTQREDFKCLNSSIIIEEIKTIIYKILPTRKMTDPNGITVKFYQHLRKR